MISDKKYDGDFQKIIIDSETIISKKNFIMMAGPCAAESRDQVMRTAEELAKLGIHVFRAGCFKSRTDPYAWQGSCEEGLKWLAEVREQFGMKIITEVSDYSHFNIVEQYTDIIQIGAKAIYDRALLINSGKSEKPVLVKRGFCSTINEYLRMVEYVLANGNENVMLCERGIRTFETSTRFTYDLCGAAVMQDRTRLPVILDPSHASGDTKYISKLALAATAFDCEGLLIEVHCNPNEALCDKAQAMSIEDYKTLYSKVKQLAEFNGRTVI